jgi:polyisoprenoid-binding protein YceI
MPRQSTRRADLSLSLGPSMVAIDGELMSSTKLSLRAHALAISKQGSQRAAMVVAMILALATRHQLLGQETVVNLDPEQTEIKFTVSATLHSVHGTFKLKSGTVRFDTTTGKATGLIIVDATSGESGNGGRDRKMHKDILESQQYPEVVFTPVRVQGHLTADGESQVQVQGLIRLHGTEHDATMEARVTVTDNRLNANTHFTIPYVQWGLKNPSTFILKVSNQVQIDVRTTGRVVPRAQ